MAWLRFQIALDRIVERQRVSREEAEALLRKASMQGYVLIRGCTRGGTHPPQGIAPMPWLACCNPDDMPKRGYLEFFEPDVEHLIAMRLPLPERTAPQVSKPSSTNQASAERIREVIALYGEQLGDQGPSMDRALLFAREEHNIHGHQEELRDEYRNQYPNRTVGRPTKQSAKK
jgi:hypothetical protein